ncbi:hypothetical protein [Streptomyces sp. NPDC006739]|uniref:hypothetical protein n=1 Tax=Streptomyces sp. NPDC006739 TaxID=3364763 RepID=UPI0036D15712
MAHRRHLANPQEGLLAAVLPGTGLRLDHAEPAYPRCSYRFLSWFLARRSTVGTDDLGDHQPERVAVRQRSEFTRLYRTAARAV